MNNIIDRYIRVRADAMACKDVYELDKLEFERWSLWDLMTTKEQTDAIEKIKAMEAK